MYKTKCCINWIVENSKNVNFLAHTEPYLGRVFFCYSIGIALSFSVTCKTRFVSFKIGFDCINDTSCLSVSFTAWWTCRDRKMLANSFPLDYSQIVLIYYTYFSLFRVMVDFCFTMWWTRRRKSMESEQWNRFVVRRTLVFNLVLPEKYEWFMWTGKSVVWKIDVFFYFPMGFFRKRTKRENQIGWFILNLN
jgi:hypothetical protein